MANMLAESIIHVQSRVAQSLRFRDTAIEMGQTVNGRVYFVAVILMLFASGRAMAEMPGDWGGSPNRPELIDALPAFGNTPDGMCLDKATGDILLASPNFNDPAYPGVLFRIDQSDRVSPYFVMPVHPDTGRGCPMGVSIGPDGNLYVADNQYFHDKDYKSRLIRVMREKGRPIRGEVVAQGFKLANAVAWREKAVYVSDTFLDIPDKPGTSGVFRITIDELRDNVVQLEPGLGDPHLIATFTTDVNNSRQDPAGADGITFDSQGNLYSGNFGDGVISKITFDETGAVASNRVLIRDPKFTCCDGMFCDLATDLIYFADSQKNAIHVFNPAGEITTLWQNGNTDGSDGLLDQPCEVLLRGDRLYVACFDMPFPGLVNKTFDSWHTVHAIRLPSKRISFSAKHVFDGPQDKGG